MNTAQQSPFANAFFLVLALVVLAGGIAGYYFLDEQPTFVRMLAVIGALVIAAFIALRSQQGRALFEFLKGADLERRKVVWPTRAETIQTTLIIGVVTVAASIFLAGVDFLFSYLVRLLMGSGA